MLLQKRDETDACYGNYQKKIDNMSKLEKQNILTMLHCHVIFVSHLRDHNLKPIAKRIPQKSINHRKWRVPRLQSEQSDSLNLIIEL